MDLTWSAADVAFRDEVRGFLDDKLTPELRRAGRLMTSVYADHEASMEWQRILHERGWAAPAWPVEHGGCDWSLTQHYIFSRESQLAGAPSLSPMGIRMVAHALVAFGTDEQKEFFLPRILTGEVFFCQGYSEPEAGSDLAALSMAAVGDGDDLVCTGSKIWTTHAGEANWMFALGAHVEDTEEAAGHHVRADRHDIAGHPDPPAGHDLGRGGPEPGLLRRGAGAQVERARQDRRRLDGRQVSAGVRARRRRVIARPAGDGRRDRHRRRRSARPRRRPPARRLRVRTQAGRRPDPHRGSGDSRIPGARRGRRGQESGCGVVDAQGDRHRVEPGADRAFDGGRRTARAGVPTARDVPRRTGGRIRATGRTATSAARSGRRWRRCATSTIAPARSTPAATRSSATFWPKRLSDCKGLRWTST